MVVITGAGQLRVDDLGFVLYHEINPNGNNAPIAVNDDFSIGEKSTVSGNVLTDNGYGADSDPDGDGLTVTSYAGSTTVDGSAQLASSATVTMNADGSFTYDPNGTFDYLYNRESAVDSFIYEVSDTNGGTDTATVSVTVDGDGTPPPAIVLDFEGVTPDQDSFVFVDTTLTSRAKGVVSGAQAGQSDGDTLSFAHADSFDFESGYFTATDVNRTTVIVTGFLGEGETGSVNFTISKNKESFHAMDDAIFDNVDMVTITAIGGVIIDDLTFVF
jgi:hypothetical protein